MATATMLSILAAPTPTHSFPAEAKSTTMAKAKIRTAAQDFAELMAAFKSHRHPGTQMMLITALSEDLIPPMRRINHHSQIARSVEKCLQLSVGWDGSWILNSRTTVVQLRIHKAHTLYEYMLHYQRNSRG